MTAPGSFTGTPVKTSTPIGEYSSANLKNNSVKSEIKMFKSFLINCKPKTKVVDKEVKRDVNEERETESGMGGDLRREGESGDHQIEGREGDGERTDQQTQEVKTGQQTSTCKKMYINFQLTRKRCQMLGYIKGLKKMNKIFKFSSNENGDISIKATEKSPFVKLTFNQNDPNSYNYEKNDIERLLATL